MSRYYYEKDRSGKWVKKSLDKFEQSSDRPKVESRVDNAIARARQNLAAEQKRQAVIYEKRQRFFQKQKAAKFKAEQKARVRYERQQMAARERANRPTFQPLSLQLGEMPSVTGGFERKKKRGALEL